MNILYELYIRNEVENESNMGYAILIDREKSINIDELDMFLKLKDIRIEISDEHLYFYVNDYKYLSMKKMYLDGIINREDIDIINNILDKKEGIKIKKFSNRYFYSIEEVEKYLKDRKINDGYYIYKECVDKGQFQKIDIKII